METWPEPILHVDMDAFFVEVERLRRPELTGRPVVVGGAGERGVVASASYEARETGIRSAMPMATARRLCPGLLVVAPDHAAYGRTSEQVFAVFRDFTPLVEGVSVDEAFLDVSGLRRHHPSAPAVGEAIRGRLRAELGLPASVGVAATKFVAKLASQEAKPDGLFHVTRRRQPAFLRGLEVERLWGVGPATRAALVRLGIATVGDLGDIPPRALRSAVGAALADHLLALAAGVDPRPVEPDSAAKSISVEETFERDISGRDQYLAVLHRHADTLGHRLRRAGVVARTITLKVRFDDFTTVGRSETMPEPTDVDRVLFGVAERLVDRAVPHPRPVRLLGLGGSHLGPADGPRQLTVDDDPRWAEVGRVVDAVRDRFGASAVGRARWSGGKEPRS